jgi:glutathione S-transferase
MRPVKIIFFSVMAGAARRILVASLIVSDQAPSWAHLKERVLSTNTGQQLHEEALQRNIGLGPPHSQASLRLFDAQEEDVRVIFYRDNAAWCPYCQKVWLMLEEKRIPYRVKKVPLNAYGDKPSWFTRKVDGGKLPALELDGVLYKDSLSILNLLAEVFHDQGPSMIPLAEDKLLSDYFQDLEKKLQSAWFSLTFYPVEGEALEKARLNLLEHLQLTDEALSVKSGPWFLGGDAPSIVDIHFITTIERLVPSVLFWKGMVVRGKFDNLDRWLEAMEARPYYLASKADYYNTVKIIPSQNGPGYSIGAARGVADKICGLHGAWELPLSDFVEPLPHQHSLAGDEAARHEAAFALTSNHREVVLFACRGAGVPGSPSFHAELADPYAEPNEEFSQPVDVCLRHVVVALLDGVRVETPRMRQYLAHTSGDGALRPDWGAYEDEEGNVYYWNEITGDSTWTPPTMQLDTCLAYLRDRIGVPRDMGPAAAIQLRYHLNWAISVIQ